MHGVVKGVEARIETTAGTTADNDDTQNHTLVLDLTVDHSEEEVV
jgi:hypothetical protein